MARLRPTRRGLLVAGAAGAAAVALGRACSSPESGGHDAYFQGLQRTLAAAGIGTAVVVVDVQRLRANAERLRPRINGLRLAVKSVPSLPLLDLLPSQRFMAFNPSMLAALWARDAEADVLLGKPLPLAAVRTLHAQDPETFARATRTQWLVDTEQRLAEYDAFAKEHGLTLPVSLEIDVGLHRGGFPDAAAVASAVKQVRAASGVKLAGVMGYDAHVGKTPDVLGLKSRAWRQSQQAFKAAVDALGSAEGLTLNGGGSLTFPEHEKGTVANDLSVGSAFVLPSDFDAPGTADLLPAAFIATPVLKRGKVRIPGVEPLTPLLPGGAEGVFVFGGNWLARPVSPPGLELNALYGRSSNQELLAAGSGLELEVGDFVFLRPTQSEAVLNALGDLVAVDGAQVSRWAVLQ